MAEKLKKLNPLLKKLKKLISGSSDVGLNPSPNLLEPLGPFDLLKKTKTYLEQISVIVTALVVGIFLIFLIVNKFYDKKLNTLVKQRNDLIIAIEFKKGIELEAEEIANALELYKVKSSSGKHISHEVASLFKIIREFTQMDSFTYKATDATYIVRAYAPTATTYAFMIESLLSESFVNEIILSSVELDTRDGGYNSLLSIVTKR